MGWMQGHPPPPDKLITQPDSNYFSFPKLRWSVCHLREFLPTEAISRGTGSPAPLDYLPPAAFADMAREIDALTFTPTNGGKTMTWEQSLFANYSDGVLIIHKGRVVYERYFGCLREDGKHAIMSMTSSITGLLAQILVAEGALDDRLRDTPAPTATGPICSRCSPRAGTAMRSTTRRSTPTCSGGSSAA